MRNREKISELKQSGVHKGWGKWNEGTKFYRTFLAMVRNLDLSLNAEGCYLENFKEKSRMMWSGLLV